MRNNWKKAESALLIQSRLEQKKAVFLFSRNPAEVANALVRIGWDEMSDVYEGKFGQRPHKISIAAAVLANTILAGDDWGRDSDAIVLCFIELMEEIKMHGTLYGLTGTDQFVLEIPTNVYLKLHEAVTGETSQLG